MRRYMSVGLVQRLGRPKANASFPRLQRPLLVSPSDNNGSRLCENVWRGLWGFSHRWPGVVTNLTYGLNVGIALPVPIGVRSLVSKPSWI